MRLQHDGRRESGDAHENLVLASLCKGAEDGEKNKQCLVEYHFAYCISYS